jgi:hypothetical protein
MRRPIASLLGVLLLAGLAVSPAAAATARSAAHAPKVAIIVGPVGALTDNYRAYANQAAAEALRWTPDVVQVYSPNATWPAAKAAMSGASVVVYLGHGNGFPNPYRSSLATATEDGLGLNPIAGADDGSHQYFGEARIASEVKLARHAVVVLSHLCYASGNSEPGNTDPTLDVAIARADNYAAGWIAAGADAVIADSFGNLAPYMRDLLSTDDSIRRIWAGQPGAHGNVSTYRSVRTAGYPVLLDTDTKTAGYHRSLVGRLGLRASDVRSGAPRTVAIGTLDALPPAGPSLVGSGITLGTPEIAGNPVVGTKVGLMIPLSVAAGVTVPRNVQIGVRWDPILVSPSTGASTATSSGTSSAAGSAAVSEDGSALTPDANAAPNPGATASTTSTAPTDATASGEARDSTQSQDADLVVPETLGQVVTVAPARKTKGGLIVATRVPDAPGLYRLVTTIHDSDGVAYDAPTQALVPGLIVRVTATTSALVLASPTALVAAGAGFSIEATVVNTGRTTWAVPGLIDPRRPGGPREADPPQLVARWIALGDGIAPTDTTVAALPLAIKPTDTTVATLDLTSPMQAGVYLVLLDVVVPEAGSLIALGNAPTFVTIVVGGGDSP